MTTFARIGRILLGIIEPKNSVETLFSQFKNMAGGVSIITATGTAPALALDASYDDIVNMYNSGKTPIIVHPQSGLYTPINNMCIDNGVYKLYAFNKTSRLNFTANNSTDNFVV